MISDLLQTKINLAVKECYDLDLKSQDIVIEHPNNTEFGDYSSSIALMLAKQLKTSPLDIATTLISKITENNINFELNGEQVNIFENISVAKPGFINFTLSQKWLLNELNSILNLKEDYGSINIGKNKNIALEHSNVNPNKAAHIGHLRNAVLGQFVERVYEFLGYNVEVQYYVNDLGVQVSTSLMGTRLINNVSPSDFDKFDHYAWEVYSMMESKISDSTELQQQRLNILKNLENYDSTDALDQEKLVNKILDSQLQTFSNLDIDYDVLVHERDIVQLKFWEEAFEQLKKNSNVYKAESGMSKGCWLVKFKDSSSKESTTNTQIEKDKIIVRSNGVPTYTGKDISYHLWKFGLLKKDFYYQTANYNTQEKSLFETTSSKNDGQVYNRPKSMDIVLNVIGTEQSYALEVVRQAIEFLGYEEAATNMHHINYGFVYLSPSTAEKLGIDISDNKSKYGMSGRKGWGIKIDDFIDMVDATLQKSFGSFEALHSIRNGAIKFEMLKYNTYQDLIFDLDSALNIHGFSGPYIQYTHARANSVLQKAKLFDEIIENSDIELFDKELEVLRLLYQFGEIVQRSAQEFSPNLLCNYLFELAQKYNSFYNDIKILTEPEKSLKQFRLVLTEATKQVISNGLYLLGIAAPDKV